MGLQARLREHDTNHGVRIRAAAGPRLGVSPLRPQALRDARRGGLRQGKPGINENEYPNLPCERVSEVT